MTKVLLVDDEPILLDLERQILEKKFGFSTEMVESGEEALKILATTHFDAIISDYSMPVMDGLTLLRKIREHDKQIPFVLFTVKEREEVAIKALNSGANFYVQKEDSPHVAFTELAHKVTAAVELVRAEKDLRIQHDLAIACANTKRLDQVLSLSLSAAMESSCFDAGAIYQVDERNHITLITQNGFSPGYSDHVIQAHLIPLFFPLIHGNEHTFRDHQAVHLYSKILITEEEIKSDAIIRIRQHERTLGLIHLASHTDEQALGSSLQSSLQGIIIQIAGHISDRLAEDALGESERKIKTILSNLPGMVYKCAYNEERSMEFVSEGSEALTGYTPEELVVNQDPTYSSLIHPDDKIRMMEVIQRAVSRHVQFKLTYRIITRHMKFRWVSEQGAGVYNNEGEVIGLEGFVTDITRQKVLDDKVRISQTRLNMLFTNMNAGCAIFHEVEGKNKFVLIDMNNAAEIIEGKKKEELAGKSIEEFFPAPSTEILTTAFLDLIEDGKPRTLTRVPCDTPDGRRWRELYLSRSLLGHTLEIFIIYTDVTDQVRDEEQIIASLHEKELLLKEIHHRVKNNLQIISGILKLQGMRTVDPVTTEILQDCRNQVFTMASIHELLYSSHDISRIRVKEYVENLINHLKQEYISTNAQIQYIIDVDPDIVLDIERCIPCGLILNELITNAVKYAFEPEGEGEIRIIFSHLANTYQMVVADNGRGMPADTGIKESSSLGTELVTRLTHQLRGDISIISGEGTTITVRFHDEPGEKLLI
jgi:PAS domain S-box-containing protein